MKAAIAIRNGRVIDPARKYDRKKDVFISHEGVIASSAECNGEADYTIDASNCVVCPGLIDFHAHIYERGSESGVPHEACFPASGVTSIVDGGTAGSAGFEGFYKAILATSLMNLKSLVNVSPAGLATRRFHEDLNPKYFDETKLLRLFKKYPDVLLGLKIRITKNIAGEHGLKPLEHALRIADKAGKPLVAHVTDPVAPLEDIAALLRPKDVICHAYQGYGHTIVDAKGKVLPAMHKARERGLVFDVCNGKTNASIKVAKAAIADGFLPDIISSDTGTLTMFREPAMGLSYVLSKYLNLGMELYDVIACCTAAPAKWMGMETEIGTLAPKASADVSILRVESKKIKFSDVHGESFYGSHVLIPQLTLSRGQIMFRQMDFVES